jgi:hypothetical protein
MPPYSLSAKDILTRFISLAIEYVIRLIDVGRSIVVYGIKDEAVYPFWNPSGYQEVGWYTITTYRRSRSVSCASFRLNSRKSALHLGYS